MSKKYGKRYSDPADALAARSERQGDCLIWTGGTNGKSGYGLIKVKGKMRTAHSVAYELAHGPLKEGEQVDHRYRCSRLCIESSHLRAATHAQNQWNSGAQRNSRSGYRNVGWSSRRNAWVVRFDNQQFSYYKQHKDLGFALQDADARRREHYGEFAWKE